MAEWTSDELARLEGAEEVRVAARRRDGSLREPVTIWIVRAGDTLHVRSVGGRSGAWYRAVQQTNQGRISGGGVEKDVRFEAGDDDVSDEVDAAYRSKYRRYAGRILNSCLTSEARSATLRVTPTA